MELGLFADATGDAHLLEEAGQKALELLTKALEAVPLGPLETSTDTDTPLSAQAPHRWVFVLHSSWPLVMVCALHMTPLSLQAPHRRV